MFKTLRIIFCVLACFSFAAIIPVAALWGFYAFIPIGCALLFTLLMFKVKDASDKSEETPHTDFMNSDEENEKIRRAQQNDQENPRA